METDWISVNEIDKLPAIGTKVFVCGTPIGICTAYYWGNNHNNEPSTKCNGWSIMGVTHYKPLCLLPNGQHEKQLLIK